MEPPAGQSSRGAPACSVHRSHNPMPAGSAVDRPAHGRRNATERKRPQTANKPQSVGGTRSDPLVATQSTQ